MNFSELARLAGGHVEARIVQAAVELGIFDALSSDSRDAQEVAILLGLDPRATDLLLNALVALRLLHKDGERFCLQPVAVNYLTSGAPGYLGGMIRFDASLWHSWERLAYAVRTGLPVRPADMYQSDPAETTIFMEAMDSLVKARGDTEVLAGALEWETILELLDVGSGPATYPIALCRRYPALQATVFDLPGTLAITARRVRQAGLERRIKLIPGDYRSDNIPGRYDVIFLSNIIHGESFDDNQRLVAKLAGRLNDGGRLVIKDHVLDSTRADPPTGAVFSLLMLLTTRSGRCYAFDEIQTWLAAAGLSRIRQINLPPPLDSALVIGEK